METHKKALPFRAQGPPKPSTGPPSHPSLPRPPGTTPPPPPRTREGCGGCWMGKDSTLLITIFSLLELSPANRMEKNINFLAWLYPMSKGFYGQSPRAQHAKAVPGAGGCPCPPPRHPAPGGDTPGPPRQGHRVTAAGDRAGGQAGAFPSSALIPLGSSSWGALAGASGGDRQPVCVLPCCGGGF